MQRGLGGDVSHGGWGIDCRQRLHRNNRRARQARFQQRYRPLEKAEYQPLGGEGATEHQRQFPRDIEQLTIGGRIVGGFHEPVIECLIMRQRPGHVRDLAGDLADLLGYRKQNLRAQAVLREWYRGLRFGCGSCGLRLRRGFGDRAQRIDHLRALLVVLERLQRPLRLIGRQHIGVTGVRSRRRRARLGESGESQQRAGEQDRGEELMRHEGPF